MTEQQIAEIVELLENAEQENRGIVKITDQHPDLSIHDAQDIQWAIRARKEARGTRIVGMKMAGMNPNVDQAHYGFLADYCSVPQGGEINTKELLHPKVEAEIAFVTSEELAGPGCHIGKVLAATDFIVPTIGISDSRYQDCEIDLASAIADNASASRFVIGGRPLLVDELDLRTIGVVVEKNGSVVEVGAGAAVLGNPAASVAMLVNMLAERDQVLPAGSIVMTGSITSAVAVEPGDAIIAHFQHLGDVSLKVV
ncbi:MAG: 2-oxo-3-hexenedioate decarboxylase [Pseudomonadales bacterium]|nr:2-oxo-3-hexenedioate decarboxylase [Pseudomonadales bacterium]